MTTDSVTTITAPEQWLQFYQQSLMEENEQPIVPIHELLDETNVAVPALVQKSSEAAVSSSNSSTAHAHPLIPKSNACKPIRRRSRVSKKTPITLLNASTTNFRALVQQFTGCPRKALSFADVHGGPITLDFERGTGHPPLPNHTTMMTHSFTSDYAPANQLLVQRQQLQQQFISQSEEGSFSLSNASSNPLFSSALRNYSQTSMNIIDQGRLTLDSDIPLQELTINSFYQ